MSSLHVAERRVAAVEGSMARIERPTAIERIVDALEELVDSLVPPSRRKPARPLARWSHLSLVGRTGA
jgi:hypothetical protein